MKDRAIAAGAAAPGHRVLVVEDEDAVAAGLRLLLEQEYQVDVASTGQAEQRLENLARALHDKPTGVLYDQLSQFAMAQHKTALGATRPLSQCLRSGRRELIPTD